MKDRNYYIINGITFYRLIAAPILILLLLTGNVVWFSWLLPVSFFTDLIDGYLSRKFGVSSLFGSRLDSIADDLTMLAGITGLFALKFPFVKDHQVIVTVLFVLLLVQNAAALIRYGKFTSFHTYSAKVAAILLGCFLILMFLLPQPVLPLFYAAVVITMIDLVEEIILVMILDRYQTDVKGLYWISMPHTADHKKNNRKI